MSHPILLLQFLSECDFIANDLRFSAWKDRYMQFSIRHLLTVAILGGAQAIHAADIINWGTPTNISGDSDVVTTGTLLYAYNVGPASVQSTTVNGVAFAAWAFPNNFTTNTSTIGSANFTESEGALISSGTLGTGSGNFSNLSSSYQALLGTGGSSDLQNTLTLTLGGLTIGNDYIFQWWLNNSSLALSPGSSSSMLLTTATVGPNSVNLNGNVGSVSGNLGQYVTATFTAAATTKFIAYTGTNGGNRPLVNAFQLREVPEPSTWALGAIAAIVLGAAARRRGQSRAKA